ncbi:tetratricopeptide repeat protein [Patescibacteria group bacterium]|nr:tetratricopeptide repeat protein [Patescibacteria group bacterium]
MAKDVNKGEEKQKTKFPKIFRFITERLELFKLVLIGFVSGILFAVLVFVAIDVYKNYQQKLLLDLERRAIINEISFWNNASIKYQGNKDAYFQLALLEYRLKDFSKSKYYLQKALFLDPNFEDGRKLESILNKIK